MGRRPVMLAALLVMAAATAGAAEPQDTDDAGSALGSSRTFVGPRKRLMLLLPIVYKLGVITTLLGVLIFLALKSVGLGLLLLAVGAANLVATLKIKGGGGHGHYSAGPHHWVEDKSGGGGGGGGWFGSWIGGGGGGGGGPTHLHLYNHGRVDATASGWAPDSGDLWDPSGGRADSWAEAAAATAAAHPQAYSGWPGPPSTLQRARGQVAPPHTHYEHYEHYYSRRRRRR